MTLRVFDRKENSMKQKYEQPDAEILKIVCEDVMSDSVNVDDEVSDGFDELP